MPDKSDEQPTPEEFEEIVDALMKVDPKGLSGKHRRQAHDQGEEQADK